MSARGVDEKKDRHAEPIAREGLPIIGILLVLAAVTWGLGWIWGSAILGILAVFTLWFFRNPHRVANGGREVVCAPADGKVIAVERGVNHELLEGEWIKVAIFMHLFNVHVNRVPCSGQIERIKYYSGKFFPASLDKASQDNERNAVVIKREDGKRILTIQIAGVIARRIACWVTEGMEVMRGERFGIIRFGSRLEVFLPLETRVWIKPGDKVRAGETPLGELP